MAIVVNAPENLPLRFAQLEISKFKGHLGLPFLDRLTSPSHKIGIKRNNYYLVRTDALFTFTTPTIESNILVRLIRWAENKNYDYLMFINK
jgi:hypothetical protein